MGDGPRKWWCVIGCWEMRQEKGGVERDVGSEARRNVRLDGLLGDGPDVKTDSCKGRLTEQIRQNLKKEKPVS